MSDYRRTTRSVKHDKRQRQKKLIIFFSSLAILFLIVFSGLLLFGNKGNPKEVDVAAIDEEEKEIVEKEEPTDEQELNEPQKQEEKKPKDKMLELEKDREEEENVEVKEVSSDDPNVMKAYTGDWKPIGTEQEGEHTTSYDSGSADRIEIQEAVSKVTEINPDNMIEHWIGRGGEQEVVATVSEESMENINRVYLQWIDKEGWLVTKVEQLNNLPSR